MTKCLNNVVWSQEYHQTDRDVRRIVRCLFQREGMFEEFSIDQRHAEYRKFLGYLSRQVYSPNGNGSKRPNKDSLRALHLAVAEAFLVERDLYPLTYAFSPEHPINSPMYLTKQAVTCQLFHLIGRTLQSSLLFSEAFFAELTKAIQHNTALIGEASFEWTREKTLPLVLFGHTCALIPWLPDTLPQKKWIIQLIEGAANGNVKAQHYLHRFLLLLCMKTPNLRVLTQSQLQEELTKRQESMKAYLESEHSAMDPDMPRIIVPDEHFEALQAIVLAHGEADRKILADARAFAGWFADNHTELSETFREKCRQIREDYLYAIRPNGLDSISVTLSALASIGFESISFHPEGCNPPDIKVTFVVRKEAGSLCEFQGKLTDFVLECPDDVFENTANAPIEYLRKVATYCIVDALHFISVKSKHQNIEGDANGNCAGFRREQNRGCRSLVRAMLRKLPVGCNGKAFHASDQAKKLAQVQQGWVVPEGRTYVQEHTRGESVNDTSKEPLFESCDELFKRSFLL